MDMPASSEIQIEFDEEARGYYTIWQPMVAIGMGRTEQEALEDLRDAAHFGIDTKVSSKLREIGTALYVKEVKRGEQSSTKRRSNTGHRKCP
jgi:hypothetical protein